MEYGFNKPLEDSQEHFGRPQMIMAAKHMEVLRKSYYPVEVTKELKEVNFEANLNPKSLEAILPKA